MSLLWTAPGNVVTPVWGKLFSTLHYTLQVVQKSCQGYASDMFANSVEVNYTGSRNLYMKN